ncbi:SCO family protein [Eoetvoesiella caeni]|uniref:Protein SCO1/2 n=1 Tax=Eoetvoesiella caeni TaxID=645616 RepID=A0A366H451_9BURK|nr:SCO family protein [Eoetvoesiella caeni]MCI2810471.1 SCO family protein [Eoetvoesiella caeni]NYT54857.1 SCO family protein [Eoetvoesiella caeni]RBP36772.1 protein SCO1/2 [Eoetvoesiella caeni]
MNRSAAATSAAILLMLLLAFFAFDRVTRGFAAVTSDQVRRIDLQQSPRALPALALVDQAGHDLSLADYGGASPYTTFVSLAYMRCQTVCRTSASGLAFMQQQIRDLGLKGQVRLLTLSFDPGNDTPQVMQNHARSVGADAAIWRTATLRDPRDLAALLELFGIVVIPDGLGGYSHNSALFAVDKQGRLARAYDTDRPDLALVDYLRSTEQ